MKKIAVISLKSIHNIGDDLLDETTQYLLGTLDKVQFMEVELFPRWDQLIKKYGLEMVLSNIIRVLQRFLPKGNIRWRLKNFAYYIRLARYYRDSLDRADAIVYAVGAAKFQTQSFSHLFELINSIAGEKQIPVLMSAMSIAKTDDKDWRCKQLIRAINLSCVKMFTTRDGSEGLQRLRNDYIRQDGIITADVGDPALWIPECYGIKRRESDIIGVGLIRRGIYKDYGTDFSGERLLQIYQELIKNLEREGKKWLFFCNGIKEDYEVGLELLRRMKLPKEKLLPRPQSTKELIDIISQFRVVFGARMHACITAFSLDIPVVGLLWDLKLDAFARTMGIREFFCTTEELSMGGGNLIAEKIDQAIGCPIDVSHREVYKRKMVEALRTFINQIEI